MKVFRLFGGVLVAGACFSSVKTSADSIVYQFEPIDVAAYGGQTPQIQAVFTDTDPGKVLLTITADLPVGEFLNDLYFNFDPADKVNRLRFVPLGAENRRFAKISRGADLFKADGGYYDIHFNFNKGGGDNFSFSGDDSVSYLISEPNLSASDFLFLDSPANCSDGAAGYYALASVQVNCGHVEWLAASTATLQPVPEPSSLGLGIAALGLLSWNFYSRRAGKVDRSRAI